MASSSRVMSQDLDTDHEYDIAALNDEVDSLETAEEETMILIETNDSDVKNEDSDSSTYSEKDKLLSLVASDAKAGPRPVIFGKKSHKPITIGSIVIEKVQDDEQQDRPSFASKGGLKKHVEKQAVQITKAPAQSKFMCFPCKQPFRSEEELKAHRSQHVISKKYQCQICYMDSDSQMEFFEHLKTHYEPKAEEHLDEPHGDSSFDLQGTAAGWSDTEDTIEVTAEVNDEEIQEKGKLFECELCHRTFKNKRALTSHANQTHRTMTQYQCGTCSSIYDDLASLKKHMVETHLNNEASTSQDPLTLTVREEVTEEGELTTENEFICELCGVVLTSQSDLKAHKKKEHKVKKASKADLYCEICDRSFDYKTTFMYHMRNHTGERPHCCEVCGKSFRSSGALKVHMRIHTGEKPYQCQHCDRAFRQWGDLNYHVTSIHSGVKNYRCEYCGKDFARKYSLIVHVRCHTGERNYECEYCHKRFRAATYLASHRRIHTGERPHMCAICLKTFRMRSDMKRHLQMHGRDGADPAVLLAAVTDSEEMITPGKKRGPKQTHIVLSRGGKNGKAGELKIESMMSEEDRAIASLEGDEGEDLLLTIADTEAGAVGGDMEMIVGDDSNPYVVKDSNNQVFVWSVFTPQQ